MPYPAAQILAAFPPPADRQEAEAEADDVPIWKGRRNTTLTALAGNWRRHGAEEAEIYANLQVANKRCRDPETNQATPLPDAELHQIAKSICSHSPAPDLTEAGNGVRFAEQHAQRALFCVPEQTWMIYDRGRWRPDVANRVNRLAVKTAMSFKKDAARLEAKGGKGAKAMAKAYRDWMKTSLRDRALQAMIRQARDLLARDVADLDANHWLLNFRNGTYDLKDMVLRPHDSKDFITRRLPYAYDPKARCLEFDKFLDTALAGDKAMISFLWRCIGYTLTGFTDEQVVFLIQGPTSSGKSTVLEVMLKVFGAYSWAAEIRTLEGGSRPAGVGDDLALLRAVRMLVADEVPKDVPLNESLLKRLASGGTLTARALYKKASPFELTVKPWLGSNQLPIRGVDDAIWRRFVFIPFTVQVPLDKIDLKLKRRLMRERAGIMNRALAGLRDYQKKGLKPPASSTNALAEYRLEQDSMGEFFKECTIDLKKTNPRAFVNFAVLYERYEQHCAIEPDRRPPSKRKFGRELGLRGYVKGRESVDGRRPYVRYGLGLVDDNDAF